MNNLKKGDKVIILPKTHPAEHEHPRGVLTIFRLYEPNSSRYKNDPCGWATFEEEFAIGAYYVERLVKVEDLSELEKVVYGI